MPIEKLKKKILADETPTCESCKGEKIEKEEKSLWRGKKEIKGITGNNCQD